MLIRTVTPGLNAEGSRSTLCMPQFHNFEQYATYKHDHNVLRPQVQTGAKHFQSQITRCI